MGKEETKSIVIFIEDEKIDGIRKKYDKRPIPAHLTLVYPFSSDDEKMAEVKEYINGLKKFSVMFNGFSKSKKDYYLYFDIDKNKKKLMQVHNRLYSILGIPFNNPDMPKYIPHVSLGVFDSMKEIDEAKNKLETNSFKVEHSVDKISIVNFGNDMKPKSIEDIYLER